MQKRCNSRCGVLFALSYGSKLISVIDGGDIACEIVLRWISLDLSDDKSTLVQVMAWCRQATSHYLSQCWPRSLSPYVVIRPQWVKCLFTSQFNLCSPGVSMLYVHIYLLFRLVPMVKCLYVSTLYANVKGWIFAKSFVWNASPCSWPKHVGPWEILIKF